MEREPVGRSGAAAESAQTLAYKSVGETDCSSPRRQGDQGQFGLKLANIDGMGLFELLTLIEMLSPVWRLCSTGSWAF